MTWNFNDVLSRMLLEECAKDEKQKEQQEGRTSSTSR